MKKLKFRKSKKISILSSNSNLVKGTFFVFFRQKIVIFGQTFIKSPFTNEVLHFKIVPVQI